MVEGKPAYRDILCVKLQPHGQRCKMLQNSMMREHNPLGRTRRPAAELDISTFLTRALRQQRAVWSSDLIARQRQHRVCHTIEHVAQLSYKPGIGDDRLGSSGLQVARDTLLERREAYTRVVVGEDGGDGTVIDRTPKTCDQGIGMLEH